MAATWTTPQTWATGQLVTAADMNTHVRDNLEFLKDPPSANYELNEASNYTTTSTSFVDIDATEGVLKHTITTAGGDVMIGFMGSFKQGTANGLFLEIDVDGVALGGDDGLLGGWLGTTTPNAAISFVRLVTGLSAGSHAFKMQWKVLGNTATLFAGAGTASGDVHPQFWVREVS